uniref:Hydroxyacyl-coenzyme A dehydrogenase, mitochondrial n=1 Tax=Rhabditophanes sp. KR3021 TaxID=114890 RepID=A0AC35TMW9_9BILA
MFAAQFTKRSISTTLANMKSIQNVSIIGSGIMGSGIAQVTAQAKLNVVLVDQDQKALDKAKTSIAKSIDRVAKKKFADNEADRHAFISSTLQSIQYTTDVKQAVRNADLVIEAVVENLGVKQELFKTIEANVQSDAIITTNTSSLRLAHIGANLKNKKQFGLLHFFSPVPVMRLLEVGRTPETSDEVFASLTEYGKRIGKTTVSCKDTPGFIVNRLLVPYMFEALRMVERGDATKEDIDVAMKLGAGYPMGPLELADYVGLDTCKFIMDGWVKEYPEVAIFGASPTLDKLIAEKKFGRKSGEGFYKY